MKRRSLTHLTFYINRPLMVLDNAVGGCKPEAGAVPKLLCRKKRFKNSLPGSLVNAYAGVGNWMFSHIRPAAVRMPWHLLPQELHFLLPG